jgi:hypothetical protein
MAKRHVAAAFSVLLLTLAGVLPTLSYAAGDASELMTAVKNVASQADKFRALMANLNANQFRVVNVQSVIGAGDQASYKASLKKNAADISDLRDTLTHTTVTGTDGVVVPLRKVLLGKNVSIEQVVGVYVGGDGQITLFYQ